jgi:hypothetical protein
VKCDAVSGKGAEKGRKGRKGRKGVRTVGKGCEAGSFTAWAVIHLLWLGVDAPVAVKVPDVKTPLLSHL